MSSASPEPSQESTSETASIVSDLEPKDSPVPRPHETYYFDEGVYDVVFLVENTLFRVHRHFFIRESSFFRTLIHAPSGVLPTPKGLSDNDPIVLEGVKSLDFERLLWMFYNPSYSYKTASLEEWTSILALADQWTFDAISQAAIEGLGNSALDAINKIVHARRLPDMNRPWVIEACRAICMRAEPLSFEEGERIGWRIFTGIAAIRERREKYIREGSRPQDIDIILEIIGPANKSNTLPRINTPKESGAGGARDPSDENPKRHQTYYFTDYDQDAVVFLVEETLFRVHRYFMLRDSPILRYILSIPPSSGPILSKGTEDKDPIILQQVQSTDFEQLLDIIYKPTYLVGVPVGAWTSALNLAERWQMDIIVKITIDAIDSMSLGATEKIALFRQCRALDLTWVLQAYKTLCARDTLLTPEEADKIGKDDVMVIAAVREDIAREDMRKLRERYSRSMGGYNAGLTFEERAAYSESLIIERLRSLAGGKALNLRSGTRPIPSGRVKIKRVF